MVGLLSFVLVLATPQGSVLEKAVAKFNSPDALTMTYSSQTLSGNKREWKLKLLKPDKLLAETDGTVVIVDGQQITDYKKSTKTFTRRKGGVAEVIGVPEMMPARFFFEKPEWLAKAKQGTTRTRSGVRMTGYDVTFEGSRKGTFYVSDAGDLMLMQIEIPQGTSTETTLIDKFELTPGPIEASVFANAIPADAKEAEEPAKPLSEEAKKNIAEGKMPYKKLTWSDFAIRDTNDGSYYIKTWFEYSFLSKTVRAGNAYQSTVTDWEVRAGYDVSGTWRARKLNIDPDHALKHVQGHLDILESSARLLRRTWTAKPPVGRGATADASRDDLRAKMKAAVDEALARAKQLDEQYDSETNHGKELGRQTQWNQRIQDLLAGPKEG